MNRIISLSALALIVYMGISPCSREQARDEMTRDRFESGSIRDIATWNEYEDQEFISITPELPKNKTLSELIGEYTRELQERAYLKSGINSQPIYIRDYGIPTTIYKIEIKEDKLYLMKIEGIHLRDKKVKKAIRRQRFKDLEDYLNLHYTDNNRYTIIRDLSPLDVQKGR